MPNFIIEEVTTRKFLVEADHLDEALQVWREAEPRPDFVEVHCYVNPEEPPYPSRERLERLLKIPQPLPSVAGVPIQPLTAVGTFVKPHVPNLDPTTPQ